MHLKERLNKPHWAILVAIIGAGIYIVQTFIDSITQMTMIDEGLYLYKGYLFATGVFRPFQDYGPWMQKGPFAYLIPGYIQLWFGPGLRTGRFFAVLLSILALLGLWLVGRRLGGGWWGAAVVWSVALNPALIKYYSIYTSEGTTACLLIWSLFFALGKSRPVWQLSLSAFLATILAFTRQNMVFFLPVLLLYLFWEHGWRRALYAVVTCVVVFLLVDLWYWPGILRMWASILPAGLTPFLNVWRSPHGQYNIWDIRPLFKTQVISFFTGIRFHFIELVGGFSILLLWPPRSVWKSRSLYHSAVFLAVAFVILTGIHLWAGTGNSESNNFNALSFPDYLSFFSFIGLFLIIILAFSLSRPIPAWRQSLVVVFLLVLSMGMGYYSSYGTFGYSVMNLSVPRFKGGKFLAGMVPLWKILANKFGLSYVTLGWLLPTLAGLGIGLALIAIALVTWFVLRALRNRQKKSLGYSFGALLTISLLVVGTLLSPTQLLGGNYREYDCNQNVIQNMEQSGKELASLIPPGSKVYWDGGSVTAVLLYLPGILIFPAQLDESFSYWVGGDMDAMARYGFWNDSLKKQYLQQADFFIIQQSNFNSDWLAFLNPASFEEMSLVSPHLSCRPNAYLRLFRRK